MSQALSTDHSDHVIITWPLGHLVTWPFPHGHFFLCMFPIVPPWLPVCIYSPPVVARFPNEFPSPLLLVPQSSPALVSNLSCCVPTHLIVSLISSRSRSVIPKLVLALPTQCGDVSPVQINRVHDPIPSLIPASLVQFLSSLVVPNHRYSSLLLTTSLPSSVTVHQANPSHPASPTRKQIITKVIFKS